MVLARRSLWFAGFAVVIAAVLFASCSDDNGLTDPTKTTGTVTIAPQPDGIDAPWQLAGPGGIDSTGSGRAELKEMPAGTYTVTWHEVSKWETPDGSTRNACFRRVSDLRRGLRRGGLRSHPFRNLHNGQPG